MPTDLLERMLAAKSIFAASEMQLQVGSFFVFLLYSSSTVTFETSVHHKTGDKKQKGSVFSIRFCITSQLAVVVEILIHI